MTTTQTLTGQEIEATLIHYLGQQRSGLWLTGATWAVIDNVLIVRSPFTQVVRILSRNCAEQMKAAAEHLTGKPNAFRVEHVPGQSVPVTSDRTSVKELF